jgi:branched-chain amino acid transport system permease protein
MLSGFVVFYLYQVAGINYFFVLVISMVLMGGLGLIVERFLFRRFIGGNVIPVLVIGLGMIMAIPAAVQIAFGPREKPIGSVFQDTLKLFGAYISYERLLIIVMSVVIMIGLMLFVKWTKLGMAFRAMAQNREGATLQGIDFSICSMLSMGIACALAGAAGALMAPVYSADPIGGGHITFMSLLVVAVGGMGSLPGAILAGLLLGDGLWR